MSHAVTPHIGHNRNVHNVLAGDKCLVAHCFRHAGGFVRPATLIDLTLPCLLPMLLFQTYCWEDDCA